MHPPTRPIEASCRTCFLESFLREGNSLISKIMDKRKTATTAFFRKENTKGLKPFTAKLLAKMLVPLTIAVRKTRKRPFCDIVKIKVLND